MVRNLKNAPKYSSQSATDRPPYWQKDQVLTFRMRSKYEITFSRHNLSTNEPFLSPVITATSPQRQRPPKSVPRPTVKITSRQRPVISATDFKVKNGEMKFDFIWGSGSVMEEWRRWKIAPANLIFYSSPACLDTFTVNSRVADTSLLRTPRYYGQQQIPRRKLQTFD